jgi:YD repeat-containing protein
MTTKEVALTIGHTINDFLTASVTQWGFDKNNRLVSFKDDATNESTWAYDAKDRQTAMTYPDTSAFAYLYDNDDNVTQTTDPAGNVIADTFDSRNNNTARAVTPAPGFAGTTSETRSFGDLNRVTSNEDNDYKVESTYTVIGLRSLPYEEKQSYVGGTAYLKTVTKVYDADGNVTTETYPSGLSLTLTRSYNDIDRLSSVTDGTNSIASWTFIGSRPKIVTFGNTTTQTNTYTGFREEIGTVEHKQSGGTTILRLDYGYDAAHDRTYERYGSSGSSGDAFEYDMAQRLTKAWMGSSTPSSPSGNTYVKTIVYNMDDDGNRMSVVTTPYGGSASTVSYTTNTLNQYTAVGGASPTHDANGNETNNGTYKFEYDYRSQIIKVRNAGTNAVIAGYKYDALGRRVEKAVSGGITQRYVYSGVETVATYDGSNNWKQNFVFGQWIDEILMLEQADILDQDGDSNTTELTRRR